MAKGTYQVSFQCPTTGVDVHATYLFGKVRFKTSDNNIYDDFPEDKAETDAWCKKHGNRSCHSVEDANEYLDQLGADHSGFELGEMIW